MLNYHYFYIAYVLIPSSFSNLSNLVYLCIYRFTFQGLVEDSLFIFSIIFYICKIEEEFPSCFQNMTRLTVLNLSDMRGRVEPGPIPFPTQFCNMIYLQKFTSSLNNFSGF